MFPPAPSTEQRVGAVLNGRFRLLRLLGAGGVGSVFEALDLRRKKRCAVKILHADLGSQPTVVQRFFFEAKAVRKLQHPSIVRTEGATSAESGAPYLVMELLPGHSLAAWLGQRSRPDGVIPLLQQALAALTLAHKKSMVHRGLKPQNLFLTTDSPGRPRLKILDFGLAKVLEVAGSLGARTETGAALGTVAYLSPDQIRDATSVDARNDLWSLGVAFYELLTGAHPFPAENDSTQRKAILQNEPRPIGELVPELGHWGPFFRLALAKDPRKRFQTARAMSECLGEAATPQRSTSQTGVALVPPRPTAEAEAALPPPPLALTEPPQTEHERVLPIVPLATLSRNPESTVDTAAADVAGPQLHGAPKRVVAPAPLDETSVGALKSPGERSSKKRTHASAPVPERAEPLREAPAKSPFHERLGNVRRPRRLSYGLVVLLGLACLSAGLLAGYWVWSP